MTTTDADPRIAAWADDLFLHGVHLAGWIVDYVDLEVSLAVGTVAQEQLAHSRELLTAAGLDSAAVDRRLYDRPADEWAPSRLAADPIREWPQAVAVGLLLSHATLAMLTESGAGEEPDRPKEVLAETAEMGARVAGIVAEQRLHLLHWQRWTILLAGSPTTRDIFLDTLHWAGALAGDVLGTVLGTVLDPRARPESDVGPDSPADEVPAPDWLAGARQRFGADLAISLAEADVPGWSFSVDRPRRAGEHAELIEPVLVDQQSVRRNYPVPVLEPR